MADLLERFSLRERLIVALAVIVALGIALHALMIEPYQLRVASLHEAIEQQRLDLEWMAGAVRDLPPAGATAAASGFRGTLANFVDQAVRRQGLTGQLAQMAPIGSDEIRMRYQGVDFNRLVGFIAEANVSGLDIRDLRVTAADNPGIVDASIVLGRR